MNKVEDGIIYSAIVGQSADVVPHILTLYAPRPNALMADVTYGLGRFWTNNQTVVLGHLKHGLITWPWFLPVPANLSNIPGWKVTCSDLGTGTDFRNLPYADQSMDMIFLDPPYAGTGGTGKNPCRDCDGEGVIDGAECDRCNGTGMTKASGSETISGYGNGALGGRSTEAILQLYYEGMTEARRVLKPDGMLVLKTADQIESGINRWLHVELMSQPDWYVRDLFVQVNPSPLRMRHDYQKHSRKNLSYWICAVPRR